MTYCSLSEPTLVLNKNWEAQNAIPARKALLKVMSERALILDPVSYMTHDIESWISQPVPEQGDYRVVRTTGLDVLLPEVIICREYGGFRLKGVKLNRRNLWKRDNCYCQYCGEKLSGSEVTMDHVVPRDQGGITRWDNVVLACLRCNMRKANKTPEQAGIRLRRTYTDSDGLIKVRYYDRPQRPKWHPIYATSRIAKFPKSWKQFIQFKNDELYWTVELEP